MGDGDGFAGELFLSLAKQGRLVVDGDRADRLIADLERTIALIECRLGALEAWRESGTAGLDAVPAAAAATLVEAVFADQLAPGLLHRAAEELPKYLAALRAARRP